MKKIQLLLILAVVAVTLSACMIIAASDEEAMSNTFSANTTDVPDTDDNMLNETIASTPEIPTFENLNISDGRTPNKIIEDYYITHPVPVDLDTAISNYAEHGNASDSFLDLYVQATKISAIEIYGACFEYTTLKGLAFYNGDEMIGFHAVILANVNGQIVIEDELDSVLYQNHPLNSSIVFNALRNCLATFSNIELVGINYINYGYSYAYPVGILNEEAGIKYYYEGEMHDFGGVEIFATVEEGQQAYDEHFAFRDEQYDMLPIYGVDDPKKYTGVLNKYQSEDVWLRGIPEEEFLYLFDSDWNIAIPLLDADGNENNYCLHLLYSKNKLIGELVLQITDDFDVTVELEIVAEKNVETNQYISLGESKYYSEVTALLADVKDLDTVKGVCFNGENYILIYK